MGAGQSFFFFLSFCFLVLGIATTPLLCVLMIPLGPNRDGILFIFTLLLLLSLNQEDAGKSWRRRGGEIQINKYVVCCLIPLRASFFLILFFLWFDLFAFLITHHQNRTMEGESLDGSSRI